MPLTETAGNFFPTYPRRYSQGLKDLSPDMVDAIEEFNKRTIDLGYPEEKCYWNKPRYDLSKDLEMRNGPILEVAGPSLFGGFEFVDFSKINNPLIISNITKGVEIIHPVKKMISGALGKVDLLADAQNLPFKDGSIGVLAAAGLPIHIRKDFFHEASRVLEDGGLIVFQNATSGDLIRLRLIGFGVVKYSGYRNPQVGSWNSIFKKGSKRS